MRVAGLWTLMLWLSMVGVVRAEEADPYAALVAQTDPLPAEEQQKKFKLPPGFEIQLIAAEPVIQKPINLQFDHRGQLFVTQSLEYPYAAAGDAAHRDTVKVFSEFGADGRAGKVTTFADGLNIPIGVLPMPGGAIVYSIPNIYFLHDEDGDGVAERREVMFGPFGFNDTHGMCSSFRRWIDGWIYGCHGFANTSTVAGSDGQAITMNSGNTYRYRADGTHIEYVTHGQVNPFGLCFDPLGNLYSADCHSLPLYQLLRGAYYPSFGKPHDGIGFGPTVLSHLHGSTGIAGVVIYEADQFPEEYRHTAFIGNPVTGRVNRDRLVAHGSTYEAVELPDFITCDDPWFRPVDVRLGPDGALYIADFYNAVIGHYEVPLPHPRRDREKGRLWRVVYRGTDAGKPLPVPVLPNLVKESLRALLGRLADTNQEVRVMVTHEIVDRFGQAATGTVRELVQNAAQAEERVHAMWILERLGQLDDGLLQGLVADRAAMVRVHVMKLLAERQVWPVAPVDYGALARGRLSDEDAYVRRAAADALGRHPASANVAGLLELWNQTGEDDSHLIHVARMALRDQLAAPGVYAQTAALLQARPEFAARLAEVSLGVHSPDSAQFVLGYLSSQQQPQRWEEYLHYAMRYAADVQIGSVLAYAERWKGAGRGEQMAALRALRRGAQERSYALPASFAGWAQQVAMELLATDEEGNARAGLELAKEWQLREAVPLALQLACREGRFAGLRAEALGVCVQIDRGASAELLAQILRDAADPLPLRQQAANELAAANTPATRETLASALATVSESLALTVAMNLAGQAEGIEALFGAVETGKASPRLLQDLNVHRRLMGHRQQAIEERLKALTANLPPADDRLMQLVGARRDGFHKTQPDAALGKQTFDKVCGTCHRVGGQGNKIGPELDGIGIRGLDRILEDVLDPSRNVDQAFRTTVITTTDGRAISGLALREEGDLLVLADPQGKEVRVPLAEIDQREVTPLSPMPANVADLVPEGDFYHLMAYLLEQRAAPAK
jgi:putative heme-binding domain-containing protein